MASLDAEKATRPYLYPHLYSQLLDRAKWLPIGNSRNVDEYNGADFSAIQGAADTLGDLLSPRPNRFRELLGLLESTKNSG